MFPQLTFIFLHEGPHVSLLRAVGEGAVAHVLAFPAILCVDTQLLKEQNLASAQTRLARGASEFEKDSWDIKLHAGEVANKMLHTSLTQAPDDMEGKDFSINMQVAQFGTWPLSCRHFHR